MTAGPDTPRDHAHDHRDGATYDDAHALRDADREAAGDVVLHAEEMRVRTERVPSGRVIFRKRIVTEERTVVVTVRREELEIIEDHDTSNLDAADVEPTVDGDHLDAPAGDGDSLRGLRRTDDGDYEIVLHAEEPVVTVQTVPVERVRISRRTVSATENVSAELAREEAVVERDGGEGRRVPGHGRSQGAGDDVPARHDHR